MEAHSHGPHCHISLTNEFMPFTDQQSLRKYSTYKLWCERAMLLTFSIMFLAAATALVWLNAERDVTVYTIAVVSAWFGLSFLCLTFWCCRNPEPATSDNTFWFYSGGETELRPVVDSLSKHTNRVGGKASLLFLQHDDLWRFKAGYNCSPGVGRSVAHALSSMIGVTRQDVLSINVIDASMIGMCTPFSLQSGQNFLLVSLHGAQARLPYAVAVDSCHAVVELGWMMSRFYSKSSSAMAEKTSSDTLSVPVCCAVCDRVQAASGNWLRWDAWMHDRDRVKLSHTICDECAEWAYPESTSQAQQC